MIALLLGSFNPIHRGHTAIAQYTLDRGLADEVWFVVSPQNPLKSPYDLAPFEHRLEMARIAISQRSPQMKVCDIEATLPYPSYTINTLRELKRLYPEQQFVILAGSDIKEQLPRWKEYEEVERLARFLIYPRGEVYDNCSEEMVEAPLMDIDSTRCRAGLYPLSEVVLEQLDRPVIQYIHKNNLYQMKTINELSSQIIKEPENEQLYYERGCQHYKHCDFGKAINDFNKTLQINPHHVQAQQMKTMTESIFNFHNTDIYNP